jgi:hypothetical protein
MIIVDAFSNSLTNSTMSSKVKTMEEEGIGVRSLIHNTLLVRATCWSFERRIRTSDKWVNYSQCHDI